MNEILLSKNDFSFSNQIFKVVFFVFYIKFLQPFKLLYNLNKIVGKIKFLSISFYLPRRVCQIFPKFNKESTYF